MCSSLSNPYPIFGPAIIPDLGVTDSKKERNRKKKKKTRGIADRVLYLLLNNKTSNMSLA